MGTRGQKPAGKVALKWSADFAYAIGLIATDGNLSPNGRHINFTSKDFELVNKFKKALNIHVRLGKKSNGSCKIKRYYVVQFSDVFFYNFLLNIGLMPCKSKVLAEIKIPDKFFFDFFRGVLDGDGCTYSYFDPRWKSSFMFYTAVASASEKFIFWLQKRLFEKLKIIGHVTKDGKRPSCLQLKYAKRESLIIWKHIYYSKNNLHLSRKRLKIIKILGIVSKLGKEK